MIYVPPVKKKKKRWKILFTNALTRPFQLFAQESIIQILGIYMAFLYGLFYGLSFSYPPLSLSLLLWFAYSGFSFFQSLFDNPAKHIFRYLQRSARYSRITLHRAWCWTHYCVSTQCTIFGSYLCVL